MTRMTRRNFVQTLAGTATMAAFPARAQNTGAPLLVAAPGTARLAPADYPETAIWGYGGAVPGPELRLPQGARLTREFVNRLPQASSVHWHGIRIDNAMDGVAYMTQDPVEPDEAFLYDFTLPDAGTYWYHPHNRTYEQMARGLYGALIVEEPDGAPEIDGEEILLLDDWRLTEDAQIADDFENLHDWAHAGRLGNWITVNGAGSWSRPTARNDRLRLRLVNVANARIFTLSGQNMAGWIVALDGMPLSVPQPFDRVVLAPSQRVDLIVDLRGEAGDEALLISHERDGSFALAGFPIGAPRRTVGRAAPAPLPPNPVTPLGDVAAARRVELRMEGGAMGGMRGAMMGGRMQDMREMAAEGKVWAFNGRADMPDTPLIEADRGETIRIAMQNDTAWPHAMHLHGHHFRQIRDEDGSLGPLRDTLLMDRGETAEIAFVADNPGDWLLHCHMLEHAAGGMMTWLRVA